MEGPSSGPVEKDTYRTLSAGFSNLALSPTVVAQGVTTNNGDFNFAGRDVHVHKHYHSHQAPPPVRSIFSALRGIRNLRKIYLDILSKATPGTGVWLLKTEQFLLWLDLDGELKILWGTGIPGAGKTVLVSIVIRELENRAAAAGGSICVCYVYIRYSDGADLTVRSVLEILVKQTVERHPNCAALAEQAYAQHLHEDTQPTEVELLQLLGQFTGAMEATFYLLDALDEAPQKLQLDLIRKLASLDIRLFITSRPLKDVEARFPSAYSFPIVAQENDLDLHIAAEIERSPSLEGILEKAGPSLREEIVFAIKQKCGGMFLHASLQLDALSECISLLEVRQTLEVFPSSIEDVYLQTWSRILKQKTAHVTLAKTVLVWVLNSSRSMTMGELERAVATSQETYNFQVDRTVPGSTLLTLCRGLITLEEESKLVRLIHYTAKDTLHRLLQESFPHPHSLLAAVCMTHLVECGFQNTAIESEQQFVATLAKDPLLAYATDAWAVHAREGLGVDDTRRRTAAFITESIAFPAFTRLHHEQQWFDILGPLHILSLYSLPPSLIEQAGSSNPNVSTKIRQASPLLIASISGDKHMVEVLSEHPEVQVNSVDVDGWSALMLAARYGHEHIVALLLTLPGIQAELVKGNGWSALMLAARHGFQGIVECLLERPEIQVNRVDNEGSSALMKAAGGGHEGIVTTLLSLADIQVNLADEEGWSALMKAASRGHERVVALLLAHPGIEVLTRDRAGWSTLMAAARNGHQSTVVLLLAYPGIQTNVVSIDGLSALMMAANEGYEAVVAVLLAHPDIQVNLVDNEGSSALMMAAHEGHEASAVHILAHPDINVNLVDNQGWSALMFAVSRGYESVVGLLLAYRGVQVNLVDDEGRSALILAARNGHTGTVKHLLTHPEIHVDLVTGNGWSALMLAARNGHEDVVAVLLAYPGIQVNLVDGEGWSALMLAASEVHANIVALLLAYPGIQANLVNESGSSALMLASFSGGTEAVELLLGVDDIDVNAVDAEGDTAIKLAAEEGHEDIVRLLLNVPGIVVDVESLRDGYTAMSVALEEGYDGIVELLREFVSRNTSEVYRPSVFGQGVIRDKDGSDSDSSECYFDAEEHLGEG